MLNWLLSRPLLVKLFVSPIVIACVALLAIVLTVAQIQQSFLLDHVEHDMQQRMHILAMAMMAGPAAHDPKDLLALLHDVSEMHGYCYLSVQDSAGKLLAATGDAPLSFPPTPDSTLTEVANGCFDGIVPLIHDGKPFGVLHYGVNTGFVERVKIDLLTRLFIIALIWISIGVAVYFFMMQRLIKPLRAITRASESMAHGNLNAEMPKDLPQDELGKLATSLSFMSASLRERIESQQSYAHALYAEQARLNALISILPMGIMFVDPAYEVQFLNQECRHLWGLSESEDFIGMKDHVLIDLAHKAMVQSDQFMLQVDKAIKEFEASTPFDTPLLNGRIIRSRSCVVPDAALERFIGRIWIFEDVSDEHARLIEAHSLAERDALTTLYNRRRFKEDLEKMFVQTQRNNQHMSLLYFDLDDFKSINDRFGHVCGDTVLKEISQVLMLRARRNESLYRLGGDEFAILVAESELPQIQSLAQRVINNVAQMRFFLAGHEVFISCSVGIAVCSPNGQTLTAHELMQQADSAMYQAKNIGKSQWVVFDSAPPLDLNNDSL